MEQNQQRGSLLTWLRPSVTNSSSVIDGDHFYSQFDLFYFTLLH